MSPSLSPNPIINIPNSTVKSYIVRYWYLFVIVLFVISNTVMWSMFNNKCIELSTANSQLSVQKSLDETNAKLNEIVSRENDVYPKLLEIKRDLSAASSKLSAIQTSIIITKKETISEEVSKMDLNDMSSYLLSNGYRNRVISVK